MICKTEKAIHQDQLIAKSLRVTTTRSNGMNSDALAIARVVRSVTETFKRRGWDVKTSRSSKSLSRYIHANKGKRSMVVRVSDHKPNPSTTCNVSYTPSNYQQRRLASMLDKKKTNGREIKRRNRG